MKTLTLILSLLAVTTFSQDTLKSNTSVGASRSDSSLFLQHEYPLAEMLSLGTSINYHHRQFKGLSVMAFNRIYITKTNNTTGWYGQISFTYGQFDDFKTFRQSLSCGYKMISSDRCTIDITGSINLTSGTGSAQINEAWYKSTGSPLELRISLGFQ